MSVARVVTVIPASINKFTHMQNISLAKKRVAAYARVSTDSEEQLTSYEAQVDYYTRYIKEKPEWEFIDVYTDEGISATNTKKRDGFKRMIADALNGKIDLIVTKSVSRFARNTVDSLVTVRQLKEKGVEIYFEKENIYTLDSKGELLITIMSSLAQEESRSISENVTWGQRKRFADGKVSMPYKRFLGFKKGENGLPEIVEEEAKFIRLIYKLFIEGKTSSAIATHLTAVEIPTPTGKLNWHKSTVDSILTNEKYRGSAILQKTYTVDFLTKKKKVNEGEIPQYYVERSHDFIIEPIEFELVQAEIARRKQLGMQYSCNNIFSTKLVCGECGGYYGSKVWHSTSKYKRTIWQCNMKFKNDEKCSTPHITEEEIKNKFLLAFNEIFESRDEIIENCRLVQKALTDCSALDAELAKRQQELEVVAELTRKYIDENAHSPISQEEYMGKYKGFAERYEKVKACIADIELRREERISKRKLIDVFIRDLAKQKTILTEFDEGVWVSLVEKVRILDDKIVFAFKNGMEIEK